MYTDLNKSWKPTLSFLRATLAMPFVLSPSRVHGISRRQGVVMHRCGLVTLLCLGCLTFHPSSLAATEWQQPTPEELSMTAEPASPGDSAVFLNVEVKDDDDHFSQEVYVREKILTEAGKNDSDVIIRYSRRFFTIGSVAGRTIHSDGTIIPFTGKALDRVMVKGQGIQYRAKVFSMPDVQVGSI